MDGNQEEFKKQKKLYLTRALVECMDQVLHAKHVTLILVFTLNAAENCSTFHCRAHPSRQTLIKLVEWPELLNYHGHSRRSRQLFAMTGSSTDVDMNQEKVARK